MWCYVTRWSLEVKVCGCEDIRSGAICPTQSLDVVVEKINETDFVT